MAIHVTLWAYLDLQMIQVISKNEVVFVFTRNGKNYLINHSKSIYYQENSERSAYLSNST